MPNVYLVLAVPFDRLSKKPRNKYRRLPSKTKNSRRDYHVVPFAAIEWPCKRNVLGTRIERLVFSSKSTSWPVVFAPVARRQFSARLGTPTGAHTTVWSPQRLAVPPNERNNALIWGGCFVFFEKRARVTFLCRKNISAQLRAEHPPPRSGDFGRVAPVDFARADDGGTPLSLHTSPARPP